MDPLDKPIDPTANKRDAIYQKALEAIQQAHHQKILAVFQSPEGDALLDCWDDMYVRQPVVRLNDKPGANEMREGVNGFIRMIRAVVNRSREIK